MHQESSEQPAIDRPSKTTATLNKQPPEQQEPNKKNQTNTEPAIDRPSKQQQHKKNQTISYTDIPKNSTKRTKQTTDYSHINPRKNNNKKLLTMKQMSKP